MISATASWNEAHRSLTSWSLKGATLSASRRSAVFNPDSEKSGSGRPTIGRGRKKRLASPRAASSSTAGPPGYGSPSSLAVLSKASPSASSSVVPSRTYSPTPSTATIWVWPPEARNRQ